MSHRPYDSFDYFWVIAIWLSFLWRFIFGDPKPRSRR